MIFREAVPGDIKQIQLVRNAVTENTLSDPALITDDDVATFITQRGKGWVCEMNGTIVGFAIVDRKERNVWALFVHPLQEKKGIGKTLHKAMLDWYFTQTTENIWLGTAPGTRAEKFYRMQGWMETGVHGKGEIKFEMEYAHWKAGS